MPLRSPGDCGLAPAARAQVTFVRNGRRKQRNKPPFPSWAERISSSNKLLKLLQKTIKDVSAHITVDCELCKAKGYLCEVIDRSSGVAQHAQPQPLAGFGSSVLICAGVPKPAAHLSVPRLGAPVSARAPTTARIRCAIASHRIACGPPEATCRVGHRAAWDTMADCARDRPRWELLVSVPCLLLEARLPVPKERSRMVPSHALTRQ